VSDQPLVERKHPDVGLSVPSEVDETPRDQRAAQLPRYLQRLLPYYGHPEWLVAERWRSFVRNQPLAIVCRDTLISNILSLDWSVSARNPEDQKLDRVKKAIDYYTELFTYLEGDLDTYIELLLQDTLDLPFGGAVEVGREGDEPDGVVLWAEHIDAATLYPTYDPEFPVSQIIRDVPMQVVSFPSHSIERVYMTPRPELRRKGWGMPPPEKVYLAVEMLFRGDYYYWQMLLDTPEAGILDLGDMQEAAAAKWLAEFRAMFSGIDGFKIPVLHSHTTPAQWIPLNRPPIDLLYDKTTLKYAQILAAGYGLRLSDIGMGDLAAGGEGTLAGVIRGERQTRRSGFGVVKEKVRNHFDHLLPKELQFNLQDRDVEEMVGRGRALLALSQGLGTAIGAGIIDTKEARSEFSASGVFDTDIDPDKEMEQGQEQLGGLAALLGIGKKGQKPGEQPPGQAEAQADEDEAAEGEDEVPPSQGGRGAQSSIIGRIIRRARPTPRTPPTHEELEERLRRLIEPGLKRIPNRAEGAYLRRLLKVATRKMVPHISTTLRAMTDDQIQEFWLPESHKLTFGESSAFTDIDLIVRQDDEAKDALNAPLDDEDWWKLVGKVGKQDLVDLYVAAYGVGAQDMAEQIARALYEEGRRRRPGVAISFSLRNRRTLELLDRTAAELVRRIDEGTRTFIRRIIVSGVRQGVASPEIAQALRDGATAEDILRMDGFLDEAIDTIRSGLTDMAEGRTKSIVNTEINRAENTGKLGQMSRSGLRLKAWQHLGPRGITAAGNVHPCEICAGNEELGFVALDYEYATVFEASPFPPGHPGECHCTIIFNEEDLARSVGAGEYEPWDGG
jgi:hypothetical protein